MLHKKEGGRREIACIVTADAPTQSLRKGFARRGGERVVVLMRIPSDDGGLGVMGRRGGLDENKQSARVPEEVHPPTPFLPGRLPPNRGEGGSECICCNAHFFWKRRT